MTARRIIISDHAALRYLERVHGVNVDLIKTTMAQRLEGPAKLGAKSCIIAGMAYTLRHNDDGTCVVTSVVPDKPKWTSRESRKGMLQFKKKAGRE